MNKQFKERLTGAVLLVVFVVIVVPALLSGPPQPAAPAVAAGGEGPPMRSYTIDLTDPAGGQPPATPTSGTPTLTPTPAPETETAPAPATAPEPVARPAPAPASTPESAPKSTAPAPTPATAGARFAVQIGSFANRTNAEGLVAKLREGGFPAFMSPTVRGQKLYRVRVGPVADRAEAQLLATRLAAAGNAGAVVSHP